MKSSKTSPRRTHIHFLRGLAAPRLVPQLPTATAPARSIDASIGTGDAEKQPSAYAAATGRGAEETTVFGRGGVLERKGHHIGIDGVYPSLPGPSG